MKDNDYISKKISSIIILLSNMNDKLRSIENTLENFFKTEQFLDEKSHISVTEIVEEFCDEL